MNTDTTFFLAANSGRGLASFYEDFPGRGVFLHIVKGGPGTGKSGFMRRIRAAAAARGLDTESILCSGDPDSLDALVIPALAQAWMDGTAPHVREPGIFGVDSDYVNLGVFCRTPLDPREQTLAEELSRAYKELYAGAYELLGAALQLERAAEPVPDADALRLAERKAERVLAGFPDRGESGAAVQRRFLSAISCRGLMRLDGTIKALCKQNYELPGGSAALRRAAELAGKKAGRVILCPRPLDPERLEAVLLPELGIGFFPEDGGVPAGEEASLAARATEHALEKLRGAKALHDRLELLYRPRMNFAALTDFTDQIVSGLFSA